MLLIIQVALILIAFSLLAVSFNTKIRNFWLYSMVAMILFASLGLTSLEMGQLHCENQVTNFRDTYIYGDNFTDYHWDYAYTEPPQGNDYSAYLFHINRTNTNSIACQTTNTEETGLSNLMWTMSVLSLIWSIISLIIYNTKSNYP